MAKNYYEILGVAKDASTEQIGKAFRDKMMESHPDLNKAADATARSQELNEAWATLKNDEKRKVYDQSLIDSQANKSEPIVTPQYNSQSVNNQPVNNNTSDQSTSDNSKKSSGNNTDLSDREWARQTYAEQGPDALDDEDLSSAEKKALKREQGIESNAEALDEASRYLKDANINPIVTAVANVHYYASKFDPKFRRDRARETYYLNKFAPGAQQLINEAVKSGAAKKAGQIMSYKDGDTKSALAKTAADTKDAIDKKQAEETAAAVSSKSDSDKSSFIELLKNPIFWILGGGFFLISILIAFVIFSQLHMNDSEEYHDQFPYVKMEFSETIKVKINGSVETLTLDEYAAGVVYHEVGGFSDSMETLKAFAIAARTDALVLMTQSSYKNKGYIENNNMLAYKKASENSKYMKAAEETKGVVLVSKKGKTKFDSSDWLFFDAISFKSSCGGKETDTSFILCQKKVEIPISWLKKRASIDHLRYQSKHQSHGKGMSQWGAYYLAKEKKYTAKQLLNLFYDKNEIISLYEKTTPTNNTNPIDEKTPNGECTALNNLASTAKSSKQAYKPLGDIINGKGSSVSKFNDNLLNAVTNVGSGTRCGVVTAAIYTIRNLSGSYGIRIPYQWGGYKINTYGINKNWGKYSYHYKSNGSKWYNYLGLDCGTFVYWAFRSGGVDVGGTQFKYKGKAVDIKSGKPGDVLHSSKAGHVMLILKYNKSKNAYWVAEAANSNDDTRIRLAKVSNLSSSGYKVRDMSSYYNSKSKTKTNAQLRKAYK